MKHLKVLAWHKIGAPAPGGWDTCHFVPSDVFRRQLCDLRDSGWSVIDAATLIAALDDPGVAPARSVLITFDDAHVSMLHTALPILEELGFPAVCFAPTALVGKTNAFDAGVEPEEPLCGWQDLRELERRGVSVQSHGATHRWLSLLDAEERAQELVQSRATLEERLGHAVELFAYPYSDACQGNGGMDAEVARAGYRVAFLCGGTATTSSLPLAAPFRTGRLPVYRDTPLAAELAS